MTEPTASERARARVALLRQRERDLRALAAGRFQEVSSASQPVREDLTQRREAYMMGDEPHALDDEFIEQMATFGQLEGFDIVVADYDGNHEAWAGTGPNVSAMPFSNVPGNSWVEDVGQSGTDGQLSIPPQLDWRMLVRRLDAARSQRASRAAAAGTPILSDFIQQGRVAQGNEGEGRLSFGLASGRQMRLDLGYLERGNVLVGSRSASRPFALVGVDSEALSKASLEVGFESIGVAPARLTAEMVRVAMAKDVGVARADLVVVEQPATFHIDMAMTPWTNGMVLLNDMTAVQQTVTAVHGAGVGGRVQNVAQIANAERMVERQIRAAGLRCVRAPGRFPPTPEPRWIANFFNGEGGRGSRSPSAYWITQAGPAEYADAFVAALRAGGATIPRIHYISGATSQASLELSGGVNCRVVPIPGLGRPATGPLSSPRPRRRP